MKRRQSGGEVNRQSPALQKVPPKQNIVWRVQGGKLSYDNIDLKQWMSEPHFKAGHFGSGHAGLMEFSGMDWFESEFLSQPTADACDAGPRVNLGEGRDFRPTALIGDFETNSGTMIDQVINRLTTADLGPSGFFVIGHRAYPSNAGKP